jgi:DNA replication protein DnaC
MNQVEKICMSCKKEFMTSESTICDDCIERQEKAIKAHEIQMLISRSHIPGRYWNLLKPDGGWYHIEKGHEEAAENVVRLVEAAAKGRNSGALMLGPPGVGKTGLACLGLKKMIISHRQDVRYLLLSEIFQLLKKDWSREQKILRNLMGFKILAIDEVSITSDSDYFWTFVNNLISHRYDRMLATWLIDNSSYEEIVKIMGERAIDRITESGPVIICDWKSYREEKRKKDE